MNPATVARRMLRRMKRKPTGLDLNGMQFECRLTPRGEEFTLAGSRIRVVHPRVAKKLRRLWNDMPASRRMYAGSAE